MRLFKRGVKNEEGRLLVPGQKDGDGASPEPSFEGVASNRTFSRREAVGLTGAALAGFAALAATNASPAEARSTQGKHNIVPLKEPTHLEGFRLPKGAEVSVEEGRAQQIGISSIAGVGFNTFTFRENSSTPGRVLEQSVVVNVPSGAGFYTFLGQISAAYTTADFRFLTERPLGELLVQMGLRGNNLVCRVRLTDSNADDPIQIRVFGGVVFFRSQG